MAVNTEFVTLFLPFGKAQQQEAPQPRNRYAF
jgi:hypothetical protein